MSTELPEVFYRDEKGNKISPAERVCRAAAKWMKEHPQEEGMEQDEIHWLVGELRNQLMLQIELMTEALTFFNSVTWRSMDTASRRMFFRKISEQLSSAHEK